MFSLIITLIAIALVAALALATIYYGGTISQGAQARSKITKALQEGNQIIGAIELYKADNGSLPTGTSAEIQRALVSADYLTQWPDTTWKLRNDFVIVSGLEESVCLSVNQSLGTSAIPSCSDVSYATRTICCTQ